MLGITFAIVGFVFVNGAMTQYFLTINREEVPENILPHQVVLALGVVLAILGLALAPGALTSILGALSISTGGLILFLLSQRRLPDGNLIAEVGEPMPALAAPDQDGASWDLSAHRGQRLMIKFFRGSW